MKIEVNQEIGPDLVYVQRVIITTTKRRGKGIASDPIRIITEVFTLDGKKIAEYDPHPETFEPILP